MTPSAPADVPRSRRRSALPYYVSILTPTSLHAWGVLKPRRLRGATASGSLGQCFLLEAARVEPESFRSTVVPPARDVLRRRVDDAADWDNGHDVRTRDAQRGRRALRSCTGGVGVVDEEDAFSTEIASHSEARIVGVVVADGDRPRGKQRLVGLEEARHVSHCSDERVLTLTAAG